MEKSGYHQVWWGLIWLVLTLPYGSYVHSLWRHIPKGWERCCPHFSFEAGNGRLAWSVVWGAPLRELFLAFFVLAVDRDASFANYWERVLDVNIWSPIFVRDGFVEDDTLASFLDKLNEAKLGDSLSDMVGWDLNSKGVFSVRSYYLKLLLLRFPSLHTRYDRGFTFKII